MVVEQTELVEGVTTLKGKVVVVTGKGRWCPSSWGWGQPGKLHAQPAQTSRLTVPTGSSGSLEWLGNVNASGWPLREKDA